MVAGQRPQFFEGFFTSQKLVDFTIKHAKSGAKATPPRKLMPAPEGVEVLRDITFSTVGEQELQLDLYRPKKVSDSLQLLFGCTEAAGRMAPKIVALRRGWRLMVSLSPASITG